MYFIAALPLNIPIAAHFYAGKNGLMVERLEARCEVAVALPRRSRRIRCIYSDMASSNRSSPALRLVAQIHRKSGVPANARMGSGPVCRAAHE
jgi:hypothetical protein